MTKLDDYHRFLTEEGFRPQMDGKDFLSFRHDGGTYVIPAEEKDSEYFRMLFPNFWSIDSPDERARALAAASEVTASIKAAKVFVLGDDTMAAIELFLPRPEDFRAVFPRALHVLKLASDRFAASMSGAGAGAGVLGGLLHLLGSAIGRRPADEDPPSRLRPGLN